MAPEVSVVIPTRGRETRLAFALDGLAAQTLADDRYEVVVVRDEMASGPQAVAPEGLAVRFETSDNPSPSAMRNRGWQLARAPLIAFMDDDCRPSPGWLEAMLAAVPDAGAGPWVLQGRTEPDPDELHLLFGLARTVRVEGVSGWWEACNILYPRELLSTLGGFDEGFDLPHWGEDTDLGLRAALAGARTGYVEDALVWHAVHSRSLPKALRETSRRTGFAQLLAHHPRLRSRLVAGVFMKESHVALAPALLGVVAAARTGRRSIALGALAPYLAYSLGQLPPEISARRLARFAAHLPAAASVDLVETVATVRGALRHRTLVI
jgi:GT2 family glycosyltransferase